MPLLAAISATMSGIFFKGVGGVKIGRDPQLKAPGAAVPGQMAKTIFRPGGGGESGRQTGFHHETGLLNEPRVEWRPSGKFASSKSVAER